MVRTILVLAAGLMLAGCATGPAGDCDACSQSAAKATTGEDGLAQAQDTKGGQSASNAPWSGESGFRNDPSVSWNNGTGTNESNRNQNHERRATASGGAQNVGVNVPTSAMAAASKSSGGKSASVLMGERVLEALLVERAMLVARGMDTAGIQAEIKEAQAALLSAEAGTRMNVTVNYHQDHQKNTLFGVSTSSTAGPMDPENVEALKDGLATAAGTEFADDPVEEDDGTGDDE